MLGFTHAALRPVGDATRAMNDHDLAPNRKEDCPADDDR
jgi:hypothetical protein